MGNLKQDKTIYISDENIEKNKARYLELLRSTNREGIEDLIIWLESTDFFTAPASSNYHSNFKGGLCYHTISDLNAFIKLADSFGLEIDRNTAIIGVLLHDLCKVNFYETYERNIKKEYPNGSFNWFSCTGYKAGNLDNNICMGHGEESVILAMKFIKLTDEEIAMIRWHMGKYEEMDFYKAGQMSECIKRYPSVLLMQMADQASTYFSEITIDHFQID